MPWDSRASVHEFQPRSSFAVTLENLGWPLGRWQHPKQQWQVVPASAKARQRLCKGFAATADFTARTLSHGHATGLGRFVVASRRWSDCQAQPDLRLSGLRRPGIARRLHALRFQLLHEIVPALPRTDTHTHTDTDTEKHRPPIHRTFNALPSGTESLLLQQRGGQASCERQTLAGPLGREDLGILESKQQSTVDCSGSSSKCCC